MIKDIVVCSREEMLKLIQTDDEWSMDLDYPWALISIYSKTTGPLIKTKMDFEILATKGCCDYEAFDFNDITADYYKKNARAYAKLGYTLKLFSKRQAKKIIDYINQFKKDSTEIILVVHCELGISRSGAVGLFACRYLGMNEKRFRAIHPQISPNSTVFDTLCSTARISKDHDRFWEQKAIAPAIDAVVYCEAPINSTA